MISLQPAVRLVLDPHPPLFLDDLALVLEDLLVDPQRRHAIGLEPEHQRQVLRRHRLPEDRRVFVGVGVALPADARDPRRMPFGLDVLRALEHHVLEQVREAGAARLLVLRPDVIPDLGVHDRRRVILEQDHLQPVRQRGHRVVELRRTDGGAARPDRATSSDGAAASATTASAIARSGKPCMHGDLDYRTARRPIRVEMPRSSGRTASAPATSEPRLRAPAMRASSSAMRLPQLRQPAEDRGRLEPVAVGDRRIAGDERRRRRPSSGCRSAPSRSTPLPIVRWPATPTWPASVTPSSIVVLPAMPTCAASSTLRPIVTPCAIWTRLSILRAGADPRLADRRPIDRRVRADLDVVFDDDAADLRNLVVRAVGPRARSRSRRCR